MGPIIAKGNSEDMLVDVYKLTRHMLSRGQITDITGKFIRTFMVRELPRGKDKG